MDLPVAVSTEVEALNYMKASPSFTALLCSCIVLTTLVCKNVCGVKAAVDPLDGVVQPASFEDQHQK